MIIPAKTYPQKTKGLKLRVLIEEHGFPELINGKFPADFDPTPDQLDLMEYNDKLRLKRWLDKSLEVRTHYKGRCTLCGKLGATQAHHRGYLRSDKTGKLLEPWEYPVDHFELLDDECHWSVTMVQKRIFKKEDIEDATLVEVERFWCALGLIVAEAEQDEKEVRIALLYLTRACSLITRKARIAAGLQGKPLSAMCKAVLDRLRGGKEEPV